MISSERIDDSNNYNVTINMVLTNGNGNQKTVVLQKEDKPPKKQLELIKVEETSSEKVEEATAQESMAVITPVLAPVKPKVIIAPKKPIVITPKKHIAISPKK